MTLIANIEYHLAFSIFTQEIIYCRGISWFWYCHCHLITRFKGVFVWFYFYFVGRKWSYITLNIRFWIYSIITAHKHLFAWATMVPHVTVLVQTDRCRSLYKLGGELYLTQIGSFYTQKSITTLSELTQADNAFNDCPRIWLHFFPSLEVVPHCIPWTFHFFD